MPDREQLMHEAAEYVEAKTAPPPDYSEYGWIGGSLFISAGIVAGVLLVLEREFYRAWTLGIFLVFVGVSIIVYSKHPLGSYQRPDINIEWPTTSRAYGTLAYVYDDWPIFIAVAAWVIGMAILKYQGS